MSEVKSFYTIVSLGIILISTSTSLVAASFNCQKASTTVEEMICNNAQLSRADERMSRAYFKLLKSLPMKEAHLLKQDQYDWLKKRNTELLHCTESECEIRFYEIRIQQLHPMETASFNCHNAKTPVENKICNSPLLSHADGRVAQLYYPFKNELKEDQIKWLKRRDATLNQSCDTGCAWQFFKDRIEFLSHYLF